MSVRPLSLCALLALAATPALAQAPVLLRLGGPTGRPVQTRIVVSTYISGAPLGLSPADTTLPTTRFTIIATRTLERVSGDTLSFSASIDSAHAESPASPQLDAMLASALVGATGRTTYQLDSRGGLLSADTAAPGTSQGAIGARRLVGASAPSTGGFLLPPDAVRIGQTWVDSSPPGPTTSASAIASRRRFRLERIEPGGDSGIAVISMEATLTAQLPSGMTDVPSAGIARFDIAAHRLRALAITTVFTAPTQAGQMTTRSETVMNETGDSALTPPLLRPAAPSAAPAPPPAQPQRAAPRDSEPSGVELSPAPNRFTVVRLAPSDRPLNTLLAEQVRLARAAGRHAFAEFDAAWCGPCRSLKQYLGDRRMVDAFAGTYIIRLDLDGWMGRLSGTGFERVQAIPVFFELGDDGRPTGRQIDGGAWGEDIPENMAPPLRAFFRGGAR